MILDIFLSKKWVAERQQQRELKIELARVKVAMAYINEWDDMPMSWLYPQLCNILEIRNDKAGQNFCMGIMFHEPKIIASKLIQIRSL